MSTKAPSVFDYLSYREYLGAMLKRPGAPSGEAFARATKLGSSRLLRMILSGERNLTVAAIFRIAKQQKFSLLEHQYFEALVHFEQSEDSAAQKHYQEICRLLKKQSPRAQSVQNKNLQFFTQLYLPAVSLLAQGKQKNSRTLRDIAKSLGIDSDLVEKSLQLAQKHGILALDEQGLFQLTSTHFVLKDAQKHSPEIQSYIRRQIELSGLAVKQQYQRRGKFFCNTLSLDPQSFTVFESKLRSFFEDITAFSDANSGTDIYQINLQAFLLNESTIEKI